MRLQKLFVDYTYTVQGWLDQINGAATSGGTNGDRFGLNLNYHFNGNVQLQQFKQQGATSTSLQSMYYHYDTANRLTAACYGSSSSNCSTGMSTYDATFAYDKNGNMTSIDRYNNSGVNYHDLTFTFTSNTNKIDLVFYNGDDFTVSYDANGNMSRNDYRDLTTASYDWRNLTKSVTTAGGSTIKHSYDGEGNRVTKDLVGGTTTHYIRGAAGETIAVYENGSREFINLIGPGGDMIGTWDGSQRRYFLKDHLGSIRTTVDQSGNVDGYDDYYAFGLVMPGRSSNSANPADNYKFTGHELDQVAGTDLNLYHANARSYDPVTGRFLQIDPYAAKFPNVSPYVYALNNPLAFLDPDGRIPITFHIRSFAPFNYFGGLFHGDGANRGFSRSQSVTSRVKQSFTLETSTGGLSDISTTSDPSGHLVFYGNPTADPSGSVDVTRTNFTDDFNSIGVGAEYAGANPFIPGSPDIDVFSSLSIVEDTKNGTLTISGALTGDNFPSTEAFVQDASGASLFLGVGFYEGSPFSSLAGKNRRNIAEFNLTIHTNKDGNFTGVTFNDKRYTLEEWNSFFENANPHGN